MLRLLLVLLELLVAMALAGLILGIAVPFMNRYEVTKPGDTLSAAIVAAIMLCAFVVVLFRPNGALKRCRKK
jgi:hypothetical protein